MDVGREWLRILQSPHLSCLDGYVVLLCLLANTFVNKFARSDFDDHNSYTVYSYTYGQTCNTFAHRLGKHLVDGSHHSIYKVHILSSLAFVVFRFPSSCFVLTRLLLRQFPRASLILLGADLPFHRFFRCLWRVRS